MEGVYARARSKEVIPEMRSAVAKACARLEVERFVRGLDQAEIGCAESSEVTCRRIWRQRFRSARDLLVPSVVPPHQGGLLVSDGKARKGS